jgi:hypothetical protein
MRVICAWCEEEGKHTLLGKVGGSDSPTTSHGICHDHHTAMMVKLGNVSSETLVLTPWSYERPFLRTSQGRTGRKRTSFRRRVCQSLASSAQIMLPFIDL